jgi:hypothetical protein
VLDLGDVDVQTSRLLYTSRGGRDAARALGAWADLVPALGVLDHVQLWSTTATQTVGAHRGRRHALAAHRRRVVPITLGRLSSRC